MSNDSLPAQGTDLPFSHKSVGSITHEQNTICSNTLICRQLFERSRGELSANEIEGKNPANDNDHYYHSVGYCGAFHGLILAH